MNLCISSRHRFLKIANLRSLQSFVVFLTFLNFFSIFGADTSFLNLYLLIFQHLSAFNSQWLAILCYLRHFSVPGFSFDTVGKFSFSGVVDFVNCNHRNVQNVCTLTKEGTAIKIDVNLKLFCYGILRSYDQRKPQNMPLLLRYNAIIK